ncbi:hypothetical protein [Rhizobium leguminosarum]|uniref:hypothetical protein n=1 Tax=Rhizobium leguminosarum TaxID=384 RepID=UPI0010387196|nr:hypothetical protein [Rhizobium leguminosarum]TCA21430.1 hypothetical protein E0H67_19640 [Rhizobium leguminosarum bv. viciae]
MPKEQKRDNAYYEERLKNEFPTIYADLKAGKYKTVTDAAIAVGLKKPRTRLHELKNAFGKASKSQQADFLSWLRGQGFSIISSPSRSTLSLVVAIDGRLVPAAKKRIEEIIAKRSLRIGDVMAEMGFPKLNASLGRALHRGDRLQPHVIAALDKWLTANSSV